MPEAKAKNANKGLLIGIICGAVAVVAIVIVILIFVLTGGKADLVGTWKMKSMTEGGKEFNVSQLEQFGYNGSIEFKEDGTGTFSMTGQNASTFKYDKEKSTMTIEGDTVDLKVSGKTLSIEYDGVSMTFEK